nr:MAG TPA: hypothetical protein [Caudoviricetes sp.]
MIQKRYLPIFTVRKEKYSWYGTFLLILRFWMCELVM